MAELLVKDARIVTPANIIEANIVVEGGKIKRITKQDVPTDEEIDADGCYVIPGLIDAHVHFRDFGESYEADWASESRAAAAGGVTTVLDMPNNKPAINSIAKLEEKRKLVAEKSVVDYGLFLGAENENLEEVKKAENIAGVKFFLGKSTGDLLFAENNLGQFFKAMKPRRMLAACHCEKLSLLDKYKRDKFEYFTEVRPSLCEAKSIRDVTVNMCDNRAHICHVTSEAGLAEVVRAKQLNKKVTCEVTPQHLLLNKNDEKAMGAKLKMYPPLRTKVDQAALLKALKGGIIDLVSTDHAPHTLEEKEKDFSEAPGGVPGVETRLPLMLGLLGMRDMIRTCCEAPARVFGIRNKGFLLQGYDADFVILDPKKEYKIAVDALFTKCKWSPFEGRTVSGKVEATFVGGQQVFDGEQIIEVKGKEAQFS